MCLCVSAEFACAFASADLSQEITSDSSFSYICVSKEAKEHSAFACWLTGSLLFKLHSSSTPHRHVIEIDLPILLVERSEI